MGHRRRSQRGEKAGAWRGVAAAAKTVPYVAPRPARHRLGFFPPPPPPRCCHCRWQPSFAVRSLVSILDSCEFKIVLSLGRLPTARPSRALRVRTYSPLRARKRAMRRRRVTITTRRGWVTRPRKAIDERVATPAKTTSVISFYVSLGTNKISE